MKHNQIDLYLKNAKREKYWILANAVIMGAFLHGAAEDWAPLGHEKSYGVFNGFSYNWTVLKYLLFSIPLNIVWLAKLVRDLWKKREWQALGIYLVVIVLWLAALAYNESRQYVDL